MEQVISKTGTQWMETLHFYLALAVLGLIFLYMYTNSSRRRGLPPGPASLPIIGNLLQIYLADPKCRHAALAKLAKKFGNVLWLQIGSVDAVLISGLSTIKAALGDTEDFLDRISDDWVLDRSFGKEIGLFHSRKELWKPTRRFTMRSLKQFGFGKGHVMQALAAEELAAIRCRIDDAVEKNGGALSPNSLFILPGLNLTWAPAAGTRFHHEDQTIYKLLRLGSECLKNVTIASELLGAFPSLESVLPWCFNRDELVRANRECHAYLKQVVKTAKAKGTYRTGPQCFVEEFLLRMEADEDTEMFTEENLISILYDLLLGGGDTTSGTMAYAFLWLTLHPHVQDRCYEEILRVVGAERIPQLSEMTELPYVRATIMEIHRKSTIVPLLPHKVYKDTEFQEFLIPAGTKVVINIYSAHMDPDTWDEPDIFRPERFLDAGGNILNEQKQKLLTFSTGKRNCPGEAVVEAAVFIFLTGIIQKYEILPISPTHVYETRSVPGGTEEPYPFEVKVRRRRLD